MHFMIYMFLMEITKFYSPNFDKKKALQKYNSNNHTLYWNAI